MRVLLDECLPRRLKKFFKDHEVKTVPEAGWAGIKNGELLKRAASQFDVFITADRNLSYQQSPQVLPLPVVVIGALSNRLEDLEEKMHSLTQLLDECVDKKIYFI